MSTGDELERDLEACLEVMGKAGVDANEALARLPAAPDELADLVHLAARLQDLGPLPAPEPAFQARLAAALATAPAPATLAPADAEAVRPALTTELVYDLDASLEAMRAEGATTDAVLAARPGTATELAPLLALAAALAELPRPAVPRSAFRQRLAARLATAPAPASLQRQSFGGVVARLRRSASVAAALAAAVVVFLSVGAGLASANALPGQPLYPVKRALEHARLWIVSGEVEMAYHLDLAGRRLAEALAAPAWAGDALAEFSGEITAALTYADRALAVGAPRSRIASPLVDRLVTSRGELVAARPQLPPTAWRSSLALLDTAIALWRSGDELAMAPVPRLFGPAGSGAPGAGGRAVTRVLPPVAPMVAAAAQATAGGSGGTIGAGSGSSVAALPAAPGAGAGPALPAGSPTPTPGHPDTPPVGGGKGTNTPRPTAANPGPTDTPPPVATATRVTPTMASTPTQAVTPTERPTEPPAPTTVPTSAPTATPSATPDKLPPVIEGISQDLLLVPLGGVATFEVAAYDPDGGPLTYHWSASWGEMLEPDQPAARFHAIGNMSGMDLVVTIKVRVTDQTGAYDEAEAQIEVTPRVEGPR